MPDYSVNPAGERFALPEKGEYASELARLEKLATTALPGPRRPSARLPSASASWPIPSVGASSATIARGS
jgi:hypothetical protein